MTYRLAPRIEDRSPAQIFEEVSGRLSADRRLDPFVEALVRVFARDWEIIASRLNQALDKNFLAYLDYLGVAPVPPTSAVVPLTFVPVPTAPPGSEVPERTQVAAAAGDGEPVVFETLRQLTLTSGFLRRVFTLDPRINARTDLSLVADSVAPEPHPIFETADRSEHVLLLGDTAVLGLDDISTLTVRFDIAGPGLPAGKQSTLEWFIPGKLDLPAVVPSSDGTDVLRHSGDVVFQRPGVWPEFELHGQLRRWLGCRVTTSAGNWGVYARQIELRAEVRRTDVLVDAALADTTEVDLSKDFYPFGLRPIFGSTWYVASSEAFARPGTRVALAFVLTNAHNAPDEPPIPRVYVDGHPRVAWEYWNGTRWLPLAATDGTKAFRVNGSVVFEVPGDFARPVVRGQPGAWVRARLVSGHYGEDERWEPDPAQAGGVRYRPSTLAPPSIKSVTASFTLNVTKLPDVVITSNERVYRDESLRARTGALFPVFGFPCGPLPALYVGFARRTAADPIDRSVTLYVLSQSPGLPFSRSGAESPAAVLQWQFWNGEAWTDFDVDDETGALTRSGYVTLVVPDDAVERTDFVEASPLYWFRAVPQDGVEWSPGIRAFLRNTVLAAHRVTFENEVLGSSHGTPDQVFQVMHVPVLHGELLEVMEPGLQSAAQTEWTTWRAVEDLVESSPDDRHYVVDRERGVVAFGDGRKGRIPPRGSNNIRLRQYATGGGERGNQPAGALTQLRTAVPYVDSVANPMAASGGADLERTEHLRHRGAATVRHQGRAVTAEDYQDLARLASPQVARAECVPMCDVTVDPVQRGRQPGVVSVIVVPHTKTTKPIAEAELLRQVRSYLDARRNTSTELVVIGPEYVEIDVDVELVVSDAGEASDIATELRLAIEAFLHPLTGGPTAEGWRLGELPNRGDLYALCASAPGVTWVAALRIGEREDRPGIKRTGHFLVCSGRHRIALRYKRERRAAAPGGPIGRSA